MGSQRFLGEEGGLFCARTSEGLSWSFPFMRGHVANAATTLAAAPANIRKSANSILRARFAGQPNAGAQPWSDELWQHNMPPPDSALQAIVPAPPAPPARLELWRQVPQYGPNYDYEAREKEKAQEYIRKRAAEGWR